jgi:hypothetical protein
METSLSFDEAFGGFFEEVLHEILGRSGFAVAAYHLNKNGVPLADCARRPADFDAALLRLFNPAGAAFIEEMILRLFYDKYNIDFERGGGVSFSEEVRKARRTFEANCIERKALGR